MVWVIAFCSFAVFMTGLGIWFFQWVKRDMLTGRTIEAILQILAKADEYGQTSRAVDTTIMETLGKTPDMDGYTHVFDAAILQMISRNFITAREATPKEVIRLHGLETPDGDAPEARAKRLVDTERLVHGRPMMLLRLTQEGRSTTPT